MKKILLTMLMLFMLTMPMSLFAESTDEQIEQLKIEVEEKVNTLNEYEDDLKTLEFNIADLEEKEVSLKNEKEELQGKIKKSEAYVRNYLKFIQKSQNTKLILRVLTNEDFLPAFYQVLKVSNFISEEFKELIRDIKTLEEKQIEYNETIDKLSTDKEEVEKKIKSLEKLYEDLNRELVELEKMSDFENLYDDNASISQDKQEGIMKEAGISQTDYKYVDYIITRESSWNYTATNPYSGAYGLCQSLPPEKMGTSGSDWKDNPVTQLKWCDSYATSRYGSWQGAQEFWKENNWW